MALTDKKDHSIVIDRQFITDVIAYLRTLRSEIPHAASGVVNSGDNSIPMDNLDVAAGSPTYGRGKQIHDNVHTRALDLYNELTALGKDLDGYIGSLQILLDHNEKLEHLNDMSVKDFLDATVLAAPSAAPAPPAQS